MPDFHLHNFWFWSNKSSSKTVLVKSQFGLVDQFDSSLLRTQISLGNIHPKEVAFLLYNFYHERKTPVRFKRPQCMVGFNQERLKPNSGPVPDSAVNSYRLPLHLPPIEQNCAKWKFMQDQYMNFILGDAGFKLRCSKSK